jgi:hypothetical protein
MGSTASGARSLAKQERNLLPHHVTVNVDKTLRAAQLRFTTETGGKRQNESEISD